MTKSSKGQNKALDLDRVAANGLLSRRHLLAQHSVVPDSPWRGP